MMPGMSVADMESMYRQLTPEKGDPQYAERMKQRDLWQKAMNQTQKERAEDPVQFAFSGMPDLGLQPITDWTNQTAVINQIQKRIDNSGIISERFGTPKKLLSNSSAVIASTNQHIRIGKRGLNASLKRVREPHHNEVYPYLNSRTLSCPRKS